MVALPCQKGQKHLALSIQRTICPIKPHFCTDVAQSAKRRVTSFSTPYMITIKTAVIIRFFARSPCFHVKRPESPYFFQKPHTLNVIGEYLVSKIGRKGKRIRLDIKTNRPWMGLYISGWLIQQQDKISLSFFQNA